MNIFKAKVMKNYKILLLFLTLFLTTKTMSQSTGDYQSAATGLWNARTSWVRWSGSAWVTPTPAQGTPTSATGLITILNTHTITVSANVTVDQVVVNTTGTIIINSGITFTIANGTGTDLSVLGTVINSGTISNAGTINFQSGSTYEHAEDGGVIPTAIWDPNSTCLINFTSASLTTAPTGLSGQIFGNFTWNAKVPTASLDLIGLSTVAGNFLVSETGNTGVFGNTLRLQTALNVAGNFTTSGNSSLNLNNNSSAITYNITGNFTPGGNFMFSNGTGLTTINLKGTGKTITATTTNFFDFNLGPTVSNVVFHIISGASYSLSGNLSVNGNNTFIIDNGGTLNTGANIMNNNRNGESASGGIFTVSAGGTLEVGSIQGITTTGTSSGNIQTATRNYSTGANYVYYGTAAQSTGSGLTQNLPANITINNPGFTVTLSTNTNLSGILTVKAASILALSSFTLGATTAPSSVVIEDGAVTGSSITSTTGTLTLGGDVTVNSVTTGTSGANISALVNLGSATRTFNVANDGTAATDLTISGIISSAASGLTKAGAGTMVLSGLNSYPGITTINAGTIKVGAAGAGSNTPLGTTAAGTTVNSGGALDLNGFSLATAEPLTINGTGTAGEGALNNSAATAVTYNGAITLASAGSIGTTGNITLGGGITGSQDLTKSGSGSLNLGSSAATLKGLIISAGTLVSTSGNLSLAGNYINNGTFTHNSGTVTFNGSVAQTISGNSTTFNNVTMNSSYPVSALTFNNANTINGTLTLNHGHILTTTTNVLIMSPTAALALTATVQDSSFVKGSIIQTYNSRSAVNKSFPVGAGNMMHLAKLNIAQQNTTATQYIATYYHSSARTLGFQLPSTLKNVSDIDYWDISNMGANNVTTATLQLYYFAMDAVTDPAALRIAKTDDGGFWVDLGGVGTTVPAGNISSNLFNKYASLDTKFTLANSTGGNNPLPIKLTSFTAACDNNVVDLKWSTASETNNDYFTIERSKDIQEWTDVLNVNGAGNSNTTLNYTATDDRPYIGTTYYRLKQTDFDGAFTYSDVVSTDCGTTKPFEISSVYYQQGSNEIILTYTATEGDALKYGLYNLNGQLLQSNSLNANSSGSNEIHINTNDLVHGIYLIRLQNSEKALSEKVLL